MKTILSIDTSCDETSVAITRGRRVLSNVIYSQILIHKKWGGVVPSLAKRAHEERIDMVIEEALKKYRQYIHIPEAEIWSAIDAVAVTQGPGLAIALEVGMRKAKELAAIYSKRLVPVNHLEGHIYSAYVQNRNGKPEGEYLFPCLAIVISGGHTEIVRMDKHLSYDVLGETIDDAAGEALDKAAKMLGLGYPGGPVIERLAREVGNRETHKFPRPMIGSGDLRFSFSGLKTSLYYYLKNGTGLSREQIREVASSFQEAVFDTILLKTRAAMRQTGISHLVVGGGVIANLYLRRRFRALAKEYGGSVQFPVFSYLTGDNAAMIGVAAGLKAERALYVENSDTFDRVPRLSLPKYHL